MRTHTAIAVIERKPARSSLFQRISSSAMIAFGVGLTAAWVGLLGYGLVNLVLQVL